ncbi:hypothetical protein LTR08_001774 [Meristemomyces frigidus]|nr:hypothetical protein LTR08_001774 [Meristemomyces frigidus]
MAAYSTGASWAFPEDMPGAWTQEDVDAQLHAESERETQPDTKSESADIKPAPPEPPRPHATSDGASTKKRRTHWPPRTCRICLELVPPTFHPDETPTLLPETLRPAPRVTYASPPGDGGRLLRPCTCKGTQKHVHEECLGAWRRQDPLQTRNYWQCPTCRYRYRLQRLTWARWLSSTASQLLLTLSIFVAAMFALGFVADPIINLYLDPVSTIATAGGPTGSLLYEDEPATWTEHFVKGLASLGLLGFAKFLLTLSPWHWFNMRGTGVVVGRSGGLGGTGRDRLQGLSWFAIAVGVAMFLWAVWKGVRAWSRRMLEQAGEKVMDVPGTADDDDDDDEDE